MSDEGWKNEIDIRHIQVTAAETPAEEVEEERARQELQSHKWQHDGPEHQPQMRS
jgi:hypothetical protein